MAAGARPNFFGVPGAAEHAFPLYSVADAERLRLHLQGLLREAMDGPAAPEAGQIDVVVVGGGPTGVETTGALAELMQALHETGRLATPGRITLVDRGAALLGQFSAKAHDYAHDRLTTAGAEVRLGVGVTAVHPDRVELDDGSAIATRTVVWGGGESASAVARGAGPRAGPRRPDRRRPGPVRAGLSPRVRRGRRGEHPLGRRRRHDAARSWGRWPSSRAGGRRTTSSGS